jgi:CubicO group peptidase (beta-lactamase class C family)
MRAVDGDLPNSRRVSFRHAIWMTLCASAALALSACGGGGGGGGGDQQQQQPANTAPTNVNAGADQTITLPANTVTLTGSASDDGRPAPASLSYAWSGSGVTFSPANAASTTATFATEGTYVITLTVSDGALSSTDTVQVTVNPAASGGTAPTVNAGADQSVELPFTASLQGSATDDGAPSPLTYQWSVAGGATGVTFTDATAATTTATFAAPGSYELVLTASDGAQQGTDSLIVTVAAAVFPANDIGDTDVTNHGWARVAPADVGLIETGLNTARDYSLQGGTGGNNTNGGAGMVVRRGRLAYSWGDIDTPRYDLKSTTKSVGGIALGLALNETPAKVAMDGVAQTYLSDIGTPPANDPTQLATIKILNLATHTAGFEKTMTYPALVATPNTTFVYSDGGLNWLADVLTTVYVQDLRSLLDTRVWSVLGISGGQFGDDIRWRDDASGRNPLAINQPRRELASGMTANVNAMARVGLLFLRKGTWETTQIFPPSFVDLVSTPTPAHANFTSADPVAFPDAPKRYGVLWWTNRTGALPNVPTDAFWAWGLGDSVIVVIPSLDLVIARTGNNPDNNALPNWRDDWNGQYDVLAPFLDPIVQGVTP